MKATFLRLLVMLASKEAEGLSSLVSSSCELLRIEQWYLGKCKWYFVCRCLGTWGAGKTMCALWSVGMLWLCKPRRLRNQESLSQPVLLPQVPGSLSDLQIAIAAERHGWNLITDKDLCLSISKFLLKNLEKLPQKKLRLARH